jgi:integrase/recombinase XerD
MAPTLTPRRRRRKKTGLAQPAPANPLHGYLHAYLDWAAALGYTERTLVSRRLALLRFILWCDERAISRPGEVSRAMLERYQRHLYQYRKRNGHPLAVAGQLGLLLAVLGWFRWLVRAGHIAHNPAADLELPKKPKTLPKTILSVTQIETILNVGDTTTLLGIRNRAIMEVLYSAGVRRLELTGLSLYDIDTERGTLMVRQGKGRKDRLIPLGARACAWVDKYLREVRPEIALASSEQSLFLNDFGQPMGARFLGDLVRRHMQAAGITTPGACHVFRHAMATHMLEGGADIRFIQAMLGHASLESTQIYTQVSIAKLKEIHSATHPAKLERKERDQAGVGEASPAPQANDAATALLEALAGDEDEDEDA